MQVEKKKDSPIVDYFFYTDPREIALLKFLLEGYDGLAVLNTIDRNRGLIRARVPVSQKSDFEMIMDGIVRELNCIVVRARKGGKNEYSM